MENNPKVFISYAHKEIKHRKIKCWNWQIDYVQKALMHDRPI